jgi:type II secretory pathway pseudopilin PulG
MSALRRERFESANRQSSIAPQSAFTMVEIALCLAVIGFALVAIIGVLPRGLEVQRENREETIINQDAQVWFSALRAGSRGYDDLTNYVDAITNVVTIFNANGAIIEGPDRYGYTWSQCSRNDTLLVPRDVITNGARIIGLLSTPKFTYHDRGNQVIARSNYVTAYVRAMSGAATEKFPQTNQSVRDLSFSYRMVSEIVPFTGWDTNWVGFGAANLTPEEVVSRSNHWKVAANTHANLHNIRLLFRWPLLPSGEAGKGRQVFRATTSGVMSNNPPYHFLNPRTYVRYQ